VTGQRGSHGLHVLECGCEQRTLRLETTVACVAVDELLHLAGNTHHSGLIVAYLPKEKLLVEADAFTPAPANAPPPPAVNPFSVNLAENIKRLSLAVDQVLPLHGRIVPIAELHRAIGHDH